jgi:catechol 2,3-dioxygenase-like lactoylglutathione lyase family enzyme
LFADLSFLVCSASSFPAPLLTLVGLNSPPSPISWAPAKARTGFRVTAIHTLRVLENSRSIIPGNLRAEDESNLVGEEKMKISGVIPQLRTTNLVETIRFYTTKVGLTLEFQYEDFYAGIRAGNQVFHLKLSDEKDPSIDFVAKNEHFHLYFMTDDAAAAATEFKRNGVPLVKDVHDTAWRTREFAIKDDQGHTVYFGENR